MQFWKKRSKKFKKAAYTATGAIALGGPVGLAVVAPDLAKDILQALFGL